MADEKGRGKRGNRTGPNIPKKVIKTTTDPRTGTPSRIVVPNRGGLILPQAPGIITPSKTRDGIVSRFKNLLPDLEDLTEKIIDSDLDHTQAIEVESKADDLVDWAPNVITWCSDKRFLGMRPFAKQAEMLLHLFEEYCPRCSNLEYLSNIPVKDSIEQVISKVALLDFGVCPHCGLTKAEGRQTGAFKDPTELIAVLGQRTGKTVVTSMGTSYLIHRNCQMSAPWKIYGLSPGQIIDFTVVATTVSQSEKTLWGTLKGMIENSPWFKTYKTVVNEEGKRHGVKDTIKFAETFFWFGHKSIFLYFAANNPHALRGTTRFGAAIDELGHFSSNDSGKGVRANGPETYAALDNACFTLRGAVQEEIERDPNCNWPMPLLFCISSPVAMNDPIMSHYREQMDNARMVKRHWATWEAHPKNTREMLEKLGETKKPTFMRDYGAQPPLTDEPLIQRMHIITDAFKNPLAVDKQFGPIITPSLRGIIEDFDMQGGRTGTTTYYTASLEDLPLPDYAALKAANKEILGQYAPLLQELIERPAYRRPHIMGVDLGHSHNALGICCGYLAANGGKFITDFALAIKPTPSRPVNIADVYENLIVPLVEKLNVVAVFYDHWSSLHHLHDLAKKYGAMGPLNSPRERRHWLSDLQSKHALPPFIADSYPLSMGDAMMLVARLEQGDCLFPAMERGLMEMMADTRIDPADAPFANLALQMATVRARGNRLLKPNNGDDDLFRAWANAAVKAFSDQLVIDMLKQEGRAQLHRRGMASGYVSMAQAGKGLKRAENLRGGTVSSSGDSVSPVVTRRGTFRG